MTAQISDSLEYLGREFDLAGIHGGPVFEPQQYGLAPQMISTACWAGFYCTFTVDAEALRLKELSIGLPEPQATAAREGRGPELFGTRPVYVENRYCFVYEALNAVLPFTGGLLVADGFLQELYVHMGFAPAWKYREVYELIFEEGRLVRTLDCSKQMAKVRERLTQGPLEPDPFANRHAVKAWVAKCFSREYK